MTVLVLDDDPLQLAWLRETLERQGAVVVTTSSTQEVKARVRRDPPDVLLSDLVLSGDDGLSLIRDTLHNGGACREILRNYRKDGTPFWNELSLSTVKNADDGQTYFVGVQKDVTVQVKAQQRVIQLEAEVAALKAELAALKATNGVNKTAN